MNEQSKDLTSKDLLEKFLDYVERAIAAEEAMDQVTRELKHAHEMLHAIKGQLVHQHRMLHAVLKAVTTDPGKLAELEATLNAGADELNAATKTVTP
jgi:hypothetical protein